ncbi:UDP-N-acetylmuramoyl-tripeptide--D-alanyl-D-alanine ligase [Thalassolituus sp. C2-1]|uniref:UDP-N-acetylmuramoyl-tripeptide--D-alanyl-D- alanine ligase n=1 Tax=Venatorbacter sp. C2-1 TaxID=2597518 RepID=UPI001191A2D5|nr:UDP-N-acetylmuramoyl-tripeptide--D-alanyl-D-alanine ligase [Thalassolituus sp. C2-1]TVV42499.1 UDP-N-acetylmuramoyl-tripeptide--D-alanyl-D-alanine ligase [Thalassolituus sp. C2-1]
MLSNLSLSQLVKIVHGQLQDNTAAALDDDMIHGVSTDSRNIKAGDLYVPLSGERFNGHYFIAQAAEQGAVAALIDQDVDTALTQCLPLIRVTDCLIALGQIAGWNRSQFHGPLVAVTGSAGKTSVKQLMSSVLAQRYRTWMTQGNLNNHIGAPLTLLALQPEHEAAVIELGASGAGEIAYTAQWVKPQVGIITNAAEAHLEGFGSLQGIVQTKGELLDFIQPGGCAILNADDVFYGEWAERAAAVKLLSFGFSASADVRASALRCDLQGSHFVLHLDGEEYAVRLPLLGEHNVRNALAVSAAAYALGLSAAEIIQGLQQATTVSGRLHWLDGQAGQRILNDAYNANPASVKAAIDVLKHAAQSWLVLGDMAELGEGELAAHVDIGLYAKTQGIQHLLATGERSRKTVEAFGAGAHWFATKEELVRYLQQQTTKQDVILVKGSRSAGMDQVVQALQKNTEEN